MSERRFSSLNLLLDNVEGPNLLLEYFANFSKRLFSTRDFKSILNVFYEEVKQIYIHQKIEILLWQNNKRLVKFGYDNKSGQVVPVCELWEKNSLYNYLLEKRQTVLSNNYLSFCENSGVEPGDINASSWLGIPMTVRGKVLGAIVIWDEEPERYLRLQDKQFLSTMADMVSFAIENMYLCDYIVDKNGSYKIFETVLPRGTTRHSIRSVLSQLLDSVVQQHQVQYAGLFMRSRQQARWRMINEHYEKSGYSPIGIDLLKGLHRLEDGFFDGADYYFWHENFKNHPLSPIFSEVFDAFPINSALVFPFIIDERYFGLFVVAFSRKDNSPSEDEIQLFRFIFYILTQLIEKKALLEKKSKYESYMKHLEQMKMMGELASGSAHHLNNILSVIMGKTQMLHRKLQNTPFARDLELILKAADDGALSIRRLQNVVSRNKEASKLVPLILNDVVQEVVEIARPRFEGEAQSRGIHFDLNLTLGKLPPVLGDSASLREVMLNLVNNALDAMPQGGKLTIQTIRKDKSVLVFVSDTGIGIPETVREQIFEPFFTTKGKKGNGLGLSIGADIIKRHKGKIFVDSIPGKGSIFMIEFPALSTNEVPVARQNDLLQNLPYKVLLVDDEGIVRETLAEMLEEEGCEVVAASNAEDAVLKFQKYQCDVIFTDLSMPGMNGVELAGRLKQINPKVPIFIITGWNQLDRNLIQSNNSIDGIIQKPFNMELIREELDRVMSRNGHAI